MRLAGVGAAGDDRRLPPRLSMLGAVLASLAFLASSAGAATWTAPSVVAPQGGRFGPLLDLESVLTEQNARGDVVVAWTRPSTTDPGASGTQNVQVAIKPAGQPWRPPEDVGGDGASLTALALDGKGDVSVAYVLSDAAYVGHSFVRTRSAKGVWDVPLEVGTPGKSAVEGVVTDDAGDLLVVFGQSESVPIALGSVFRPAGGAWQAPVAIEPGLPLVSGLFALALGMGANGVTTLIEQTGTSPPLAISARRFTPAGGWEPPTTLVSLDSELDNRGKLAVSSNGDATFAVVLTDGRLVTTSRAATAPSWGPLVALGTPGRDCHPGSVAVDDKGEALVACAEYYPTGGFATFAATRSSAGVWGPLEPVSSNKTGGSDLAEPVITREGRELLFVLAPPRDSDHTESYTLLERVAGQAWKPITMPFGDTTGQVFFTMIGGRGPGVVALRLTSGVGARYVTYGLESDFLVEPASGTTPARGGTEASVRLAGKRACISARPCHAARLARLVVHSPGAKRSVSLSIERLRGASWRHVRSVRVRILSHDGHATIQLPRGLVRVSTAAVPDTRAHAWVAYLRVA